VPPAPIASSTPEELTRAAQLRYGLGNSFYKTMECESAGWQNIQSMVPDAAGPNGREDSWGVVQIHLPDHREITKAQALDAAWALDWAANAFKRGEAGMWTCYRSQEVSPR
jgi:hypothetical protein